MSAIDIVPKSSMSDYDNYFFEDSPNKALSWHDDIETIPRPVSQPNVRSVITTVVYDDSKYDRHSSNHHNSHSHNHNHHHSHKRLDRSHSEPTNNKNSGQQQQNVNAIRYKTELCRPYEENGECKYSDKCQFAHGFYELRSLSRHPKYKTELCKTFHTSGFCPYGPRCHFIHNADETRALQQQQHRKAKPGPFCIMPAAPGSMADSLSPPPSVSSVSPPPSATSNTAFSFAPLVKFTPPDSPLDSYSPASSPSPVGSPDTRLPVFNRLSGPSVVSLTLRFSGELLAQ